MSLITSRDPVLSIVLIAYNMERELIRTVRSLAPGIQRDIDGLIYEVIIVDNGSRRPLDIEKLTKLNPFVKFIEVEDADPSPVRAIELGLASAKGDYVGVFIDAARMASPRLIFWSLAALKTQKNAVAGVLSFHIGRSPQNVSIMSGYNQAVEDRLLQSIKWEKNPYSLFDISSFDPSSWQGYFASPAESNALFMRRETWLECGGYDSRFKSPGGGIVNLDIWKRLNEDERYSVFIILGEGTFHQIHGGVTTNSPQDRWSDFEAEYYEIKNSRYEAFASSPQLIGRIGSECARFLNRQGFKVSRSRTLSVRAFSRLQRYLAIFLFTMRSLFPKVS